MNKFDSKTNIVAILGLTLLMISANAYSQEFAVEEESLNDQSPRMLSAFFGLDNAVQAPRFKGADGLPVTFSARVENPASIDPNAFTVITRSGERKHPLNATTRPADDVSERHTVLLIGEFGNEPDDPPVKIEVTGHLDLAGGVDAHGLSVAVTPLMDGPTMVLAYPASLANFKGGYPPETKQVVVIVWAGGVRPLPGISLQDRLKGYYVETIDGDLVVPIGLGELDDGDNYEHLYLDTQTEIVRVNMQSGLLMDPRDDPNPVTSIEVTPSQ